MAEVSNPHHGVPSVNSSMTVSNWESHNYCKQDYDLVGRSYVSRQPSRDHLSREGKWQTCEQGSEQFIIALYSLVENGGSQFMDDDNPQCILHGNWIV